MVYLRVWTTIPIPAVMRARLRWKSSIHHAGVSKHWDFRRRQSQFPLLVADLWCFVGSWFHALVAFFLLGCFRSTQSEQKVAKHEELWYYYYALRCLLQCASFFFQKTICHLNCCKMFHSIRYLHIVFNVCAASSFRHSHARTQFVLTNFPCIPVRSYS